MAFQVYDFRTDIRNLLVTPQIRSRFLRMEPGQVAGRHSHDLGHEIFLILQGRCVFEISGEQAELGPGQLCIALVDEPHSVRVISEEPLIMYLSVTPHIQPTHTGRTPEGERLPVHFIPSSAYDTETDTQTPVEVLADRWVQSFQVMAAVAQESARQQAQATIQLKQALAAGNDTAAQQARNTMWEGVYQTFKQLHALGDQWNTLAPRMAKTE
jgi:quercetin dioxygenase-like cupin family protein